MPYIITQAELEHLTEEELRHKFNAILSDLASRGMTAADCPLAMVTLKNIRLAIKRKQASRTRNAH